MTVKELLARMDSDELSEWQAYYSIDPFGDQRADLRAGIIAAATVAPYVEKGKDAPTPYDFMAYRDKPEKKEISLTGKDGFRAACMILGK